MIISVGWPEGVAPSGSHRSRRDNLSSPGSCHPVHRDPCTHARPDGFSLSHPTPPGSMLPVDRTNNTKDDPAPWLHPHRAQQGLHGYYGPVRQHAPRRYSLPSRFQPLGNSLSPSSTAVSRRAFPRSAQKPQNRAHVAYMPDTAWPEKRTPARLIPG